MTCTINPLKIVVKAQYEKPLQTTIWRGFNVLC